MKACDGLGRRPGPGANHLEGHLAFAGQVLGPVHDPHAAPPQDAHDPVAGHHRLSRPEQVGRQRVGRPAGKRRGRAG